MKPRNFDEWWKEYDDRDNWQTAKEAWNIARIGMITEDAAIRIPPVSEWPDDARGVAIQYAYMNESTSKLIWETLQYIHRPTPPWTPQVGDKVFVGSYNQVGVIKQVSSIHGYMVFGFIVWYDLKDLRPFDPDKIGEEW